MTTRAIGYVRVSTEEQALEGYSLEAQRAKLAGYAVASDLELVAVLADEGISGKRTDNRPRLQDALRRLRAHEAEALVVVKLDRLSRSTTDVLALVDRCGREGWSLHSLAERLDTASAMGRFVVTIFAALAQAEREVIGERTRAAMQHMKARGLRVGTIRYGYAADASGRLVMRRDEQEALSVMRTLRASGATYRAIAADLGTRGFRPRSGGRWYAETVRSALAHSTEAGS